MAAIDRHMIDRGDGVAVELFQVSVDGGGPAGALLFVHGNQGGRLIGGREFADSGALDRFSARFKVTTAAVSQPGFGASEGPADFCGPDTQRAIVAALSFLQDQPSVDPGRLVLYGNSRGAVAAAMVATQFSGLRATILLSGVYDLEAIYVCSPRGLREAIKNEAGLSKRSFQDRSALHHVKDFRSEALILHGRYDDRAPVSQAEKFADALSDAGVAVTLGLVDCGHQVPRENSRGIVEPFLDRVFSGTETYH